jgi:nucleoside-diphosphate-sugar epimerase
LNATKLDVANIIMKYIPYKLTINSTLEHDKDGRNYFVDYSKIKDRLGFRSSDTLESGIMDLVTLYKAISHDITYR